ncbi:MAG: PAS domain S-box protein [Steroidobacteraceae bacterium]
MKDVTDNAPLASQLSLRRVRVAYLLAVVTPAAAVLVRFALSLWTGDRPFQILFIIPIIVSAYAGGLGPGLLATALCALAMDWFAVPPLYSLAFDQPIDVFYWCLLILVGVLISVLNGALHRSRADNRSERELRSRAERALAELDRSQHLLAAVVDNSAAVIYVKDLQGRYLLVNRRYEEIFHLGPPQILGKTDHELFAAEDADRFRTMDRRVAASDAALTEEEVVPLIDGLHTFISVKSQLRDPSGAVYGIFGISTDITERRRAEETTRRFAAIVESSEDAIISKTLQGIITSWNPGAEKLFGFSSKEAIGMPMQMLIPPERLQEEPQILQRIGLGDSIDHFETVRVGKDGRRIDISATISPVRDSQNRIVGASTIARDITERRNAQNKLQAQLERLNLLHQITRATGERQDLPSIFQVVIRTLEDQLSIDFGCICLYEPADNKLVVHNVGVRSQELALALALTEQAHVNIDENGLSRCVRGQLVYEPDVGEVQSPFPQRLARGGLRALVAAPLLVESTVFGVLIAARHAANSFSSGECEFLRQLSEHVALAAHQAHLYRALQIAYDDLRQTQQAVLQQERLRALGQMASGIAHDINNSISPIALYTDALLERETNLSAHGRSQLETIQRAVEDVSATVARMREFYRQRETQMSLAPVQVNQLVQQVVDLTRARWRDMPQRQGVAIELQLELSSEQPVIMGVESEIREALTNLVFNAVDAMPEGGALILCTRAVDTGQVQIEVSDTGNGMDENARRRCLEPFFTTKGERGTGLGLAMVYGVIQRHSGEIEIDSTLGTGTTVRLIFTACTNAAAPSQSAAISSIPTGMRILIVDDDPVLLNTLRDTLGGDGHTIVTANGGREGIDMFRAAQTGKQTFDVVVTDLGMPYVDGRQVASAIKTASPSTPIILLTGWGQRLVAEGDVPAHVDMVLNKPPKLRDLREALVRCCRRSDS